MLLLLLLPLLLLLFELFVLLLLLLLVLPSRCLGAEDCEGPPPLLLIACAEDAPPFCIEGLMSSAQLASVSEVEPVACWCMKAFMTA